MVDARVSLIMLVMMTMTHLAISQPVSVITPPLVDPICRPRVQKIRFAVCPKKVAGKKPTGRPAASAPEALVVAVAAPTEATRDTDVNYASADCGATVLASTPGCKGVSNVLTAPNDSYMVFPCTAPMSKPLSIIIRLCEEVGIEALHLANHEFFSSAFRRVSVFGSHSFLGTEDAAWEPLGTWEALNKREPQALLLNETRWFPIVKLDLLSFYPSEEPVCPLTSVKVYGKSGVQDLKAKMLSVVEAKVNTTKPKAPQRISRSRSRRFAGLSNTSAEPAVGSWWHAPLVLPLLGVPLKVTPAAPRESPLAEKEAVAQTSAFGVLLVRINKLEEREALRAKREEVLQSHVRKLRLRQAKLLRRVAFLEKAVNGTKKKKLKWFS